MSMKSGKPPLSADLPPALAPAAIEEAAAHWFVRRQAGFGSGDEVRFNAWLAADPRCGAALAELEKAWETVSYPGRTGQGDEARQRLESRRRARRRRGLAIGCVGLAAGVALMFALLSGRSPALDPKAEPVSVAIRPDRQLLPDGSVIERNAQTDVEIDYSGRERRVRLTRGEALFTVAHDASRPFFVVAGGVEVRAVGTEFSVRYDPRQINVLVTEGRVAVTKIASAAPGDSDAVSPAATSALAEPVYVVAGRHVVMPSNLPLATAPEIKPMAASEIAAALAWRGKRIEFTRTPLAKVAELFNRQNRLQLSIDDAATGDLRITGLFWADDLEGFVRLLESGFKVTAERSGDVIRLRQQ